MSAKATFSTQIRAGIAQFAKRTCSGNTWRSQSGDKWAMVNDIQNGPIAASFYTSEGKSKRHPG